MGDTLKGTFRFEKMSGSFKKGETLRFADYSLYHNAQHLYKQLPQGGP